MFLYIKGGIDIKQFIAVALIGFIAILVLFTYLTIVTTENVIFLFLFTIAYYVITLFYFYHERKNIISIKTLFVVIFSAMIGLSPLFYYMDRHTQTLNTGNSIDYQYPIILIGYLIMVIGLCINFKREKKEKLEEKKQLTRQTMANYNFYFSIVLLIISFVTNLFFIIANKNLFLGESLEAGRMEAIASNGIIVVLSSFNYLGLGLLYEVTLQTKKWKKLFCFFLVVNIIFYIIRGSRTNIVYFLLIILLIRNHYKKIKIRSFVMIFIILLAGLSILQVLRTYMSGEQTNFIGNIYGILEVGSINLDYIVITFPDKINFQYGYTFLINILMLLPGPDVDFTLWLKQSLGMTFAGGGVTPTIIGEGYINFGYIGVIVTMLIVGVVGKLLDKRYVDPNTDCVWASYLAVLFFGIFKNGFSTIEVSILIYIFLYIAYKIILMMSTKHTNKTIDDGEKLNENINNKDFSV